MAVQAKPTAIAQSRCLSQGQAKQVLDGQAELDSCIRELRATPAFAAVSGKPCHTLVQPKSQGASRFERSVVLLPVVCAIAGLGMQRLTHRSRLPDGRERFMQQRQ